MKFNLLLATLIVKLAATSTLESEGIHTDVMSYVNHIMEGFPMMRGSLCYDTFIPHISSVAEQAKNLSQVCVSTAVAKRNALEQKGRAELMTAVKRIQDSLINCDSNPDPLGYLNCLKNIVDDDKQILDMIAKRSGELIKQFADALKVIENEKYNCQERVLDDAKLKSDEAFSDLKKCIENGLWPDSTSTKLPDIQTDDDSELEQPSQRTGP